MKKFKQFLRLLLFTLFLIMAAFGIGLSNSFTGSREEYMNREIRTEQSEKREDQDDESDEIS